MENFRNRGLLVGLTIKQWSGRKYDKDVTKEIDDTHQATDSGRFNKLLVSKDKLAEIRKITSQMTLVHRKYTLPWFYNGVAILPTANYLSYEGEMQSLKAEFDGKVNQLLRDYAMLIEEAKINLGTLFKPEDYPLTERDLRSKYKVEWSLQKLPDTEDFRVDLDEDTIEKIKEDAEEKIKETIDGARITLYSRLIEHLERFYTNMKDNKRFHDSSVYNMLEVIRLIPGMNITGDEKLSELSTRMGDYFSDINIAVLRTNKDARKKAAAVAKMFLESLRKERYA
jgi:hypothetical protein